jgi:hypothetical protein
MGRAVDLVLEDRSGRIVGVEVAGRVDSSANAKARSRISF